MLPKPKIMGSGEPGKLPQTLRKIQKETKKQL